MLPPPSERDDSTSRVGEIADRNHTALIEPLTGTIEDIESSAVPEAFQFIILIVARTVCYWSTTDRTAVVQIANPSHQYVYLKRNTLLLIEHISPVSVAVNNTSTAIQTNSKTIESTRNELRAALTTAFENTTFSPGECARVLKLCTKYQNVFSLSPQELGKYAP